MLRLYVPVYTITLTLSAFLLFDIQPLFGKMILPMLGGSPAVWNTAMVFFQAMLLGGYAYAHATSYFLRPRAQAILHIVLLLVCAAALPLSIPEAWREPPATSNPAFWQLMMMTVSVGGPFFVLAATAPMLQRWFSFTDHPEAHNPYFLYAASNFGSMSALLLYPLLFEPLMALKTQSLGWTGGYGALILMTALCALLVAKRGGRPEAAAANGPANDNALRPGLVLQWLVLAFVPSSLMLGVTTYITTDIAAAPLLWIMPLTLYIGTFIVAFARVSPVRLRTVLLFQGMVMAVAIALFASGFTIHKIAAVGLHLLLLFLTALFCHMQLAATRPDARHLTAFYLIMSLGGVLGGMFNALLAPQVFTVPVEYALVLALAAFLRYQTDKAQTFPAALGGVRERMGKNDWAGLAGQALLPLLAAGAGLWMLFFISLPWEIGLGMAIFIFLLFLTERRWAFAVPAAAILILHPGYVWQHTNKTLAWERNFFGVMRVSDQKDGVRYFAHGTTIHGAQPLDEKLRLTPISYYYKDSAAWDIFRSFDARPSPQRVAVLGLGIGTVACYPAPGRHFDFYEIDPDVVAIAENEALFTYLSDCGSPYDVIVGDGRLKMEKAPDAAYDLILLDAFSSDNIPVHLMTLEAFSGYLRKLKPDGVIGVNISNRYLDLEPVVAALARDLGLRVKFKRKRGKQIEGTDIFYSSSMFAVLARDEAAMAPFTAEKRWKTLDIPPGKKAWRDDFSNLVGALRLEPPTVSKDD